MRRTGRSDHLKRKWVVLCRSVRFVYLLVAMVSLSLLMACELPDFTVLFGDSDTQKITSSAEEIVLEWDAPSESDVVLYNVYVRTHGTSSWETLGSIDAAGKLEYVVAYSTLGNGIYDFAVVALGADGLRSDYHSSLDPTALPDTGWYLVWNR
jgi:hypothetical protein